MLLTIYVDDIIIACADLNYVKEVKSRFCDHFDMTDMGEMEHFLMFEFLETVGAFDWIKRCIWKRC